jgi:Rrf2 family protein
MAHLTVGVEYGLHCLLWLMICEGTPMSSRDLAQLQDVSPTFVAKIFPKLEKAGIVRAKEGVRGGYQLATAPEAISILEVVDAIEGKKPLFECREVRHQCALFGTNAPDWATRGVCAIHAVMLRAEEAMRRELARQSLADLAAVLALKMPPEFTDDVREWLDERVAAKGKKTAKDDPAFS